MPIKLPHPAILACSGILCAPIALAQSLPTGEARPGLEGPDRIKSSDLRLNDIQVVGTHNSYKKPIPPPELNLLRERSPQSSMALDYGHPPLIDQLNLGLRQLEIDVVNDPEGGRFAKPLLPAATAGQPGAVAYDATGMQAPGFKVLHVPDVDVRSHCATFVLCLSQVKAWSKAHPDHAPILIMLNAKEGGSNAPDGVVPLLFDAKAYDALDAEIRSVFAPDQLITPDQVRGGAATLRQGVLAGGWPSLDAARGKVFFALDESPEKVAIYMRGHASLEGLAMFVNSIDPTADHAAYFTLNDPLGQLDQIQTAVRTGFVVRTRADANTDEARINDTRRREAAFASGAQYISTDYEIARTDFGPYSVKLPGSSPARCNPIRRDGACRKIGAR